LRRLRNGNPNAVPTAESTAWSAAPFLPSGRGLPELSRAADRCTGCPLFRDATQTVFGNGRASASLMIVGEQPGEREDLNGTPFVGPAGRVLWQCVDDAGIDRAEVYVTNAVKHFKHELRGKRRIHQRPTSAEIDACHPWLAAELEAVASPVIVALGATAGRALLGKSVGIAATRGRPLPLDGRVLFVTYHPSAVLRGDERADEIRAALVDDLSLARGAADSTQEVVGHGR
jgi:uracil-DNA glycosylase